MRALLLAAALAAMSGCDFAPILDVPTPAFVPGFVLTGALVADSTVQVRVTTATDPYGSLIPDAGAPTVTLWREGQFVATLAPLDCGDGGTGPGGGAGATCHVYVAPTVVVAGATYVLRVEGAGLPTAEATVAVPRPPAVSADVVHESGGRDRVTLHLDDLPGPDRYVLDITRRYLQTRYDYDESGQPIGEGTVVSVFGYVGFRTPQPALVAAAGPTYDGTLSRVLFGDATFDGTRWTAALTLPPFPPRPSVEPDGPRRLRLFAVDATASDAALAQALSITGGGDNPFAEPGNAPSNVAGGYGLVAGVALAEVALPDAP